MTAAAVWTPDEQARARSRLRGFLEVADCADVAALDRRARLDPGWFWDLAQHWLELDWQCPPERTVDGLAQPHRAQWFPGGALNIADNAVDRWIRRGRGDETALGWETEDGAVGGWTFTELAAEVGRVARGLMDLGVGFGDRVGIQLPMVRESVVASLACARIGAITVLLFSGFGAGAVAQRLRDCGAVALICADGFPRRGTPVGLREGAARASAAVPSLHTCVVVELGGPDGPRLPGEVAWDALGGPGGRLPHAVRTPADHPLMIAYTSGTTGAPKGVTLGHSGFAVKAGTDAAWCFDVGVGDTSAWITDPGWIMGPITVLGGLVAGSAVAVYGGAVDFPDPGRVWRFARNARVTMLGVSPTLVRTLARGASAAVPDEALPDLRVLASSGEPWTPDAFDWLFRRIGRGRVPVINYSGGTEVSGAILSNTTMQPIAPCAFAGPVPGMGAEVADTEGRTVTGTVGELVLRRPSPGMPLGFWGDRQRYEKTYWSQWPGSWLHGDFALAGADGRWFIRGRSDDTMNVAGKRIGPAEIEQVAAAHHGVAEAAAFGVPDPVKGESVVVLAVPAAEPGPAELAAEVKALIRDRLGAALCPGVVHVVAGLPRTRSGKILRRIVRAIYLGEDPGDLSVVEDQRVLAAVRGLR